MINLIDVTLRDGGHAVKFDWPMDLAQNYYNLMSKTNGIKYVELGYWGQTAKSTNTFYNLNYNSVLEVTQGQQNKNVSIMIDYHYCNHDVTTYPTDNQSEIGMIRMCSRKQDIDKALIFGEKLKNHTGIPVSFNIFNATNYTKDELKNIALKVSQCPFDYVYCADTHGCLDLRYDYENFKDAIDILKKSGKKVGLHLHDHSGKAYLNYSMLEKLNINSTDTSVRGMGKGSGNLKLEHIVNKDDLTDLAQFIINYEDILTMKPTPYELITAKYGLTDNYANQGKALKIDIVTFDEICSSISGQDKDTYDKEILVQNDRL
jgi:4-hydroxy 2-oxovalerate aldolase